MRKAVEHTLARREARGRQAIILLIKKKAGLLPVFKIDLVFDAVFAYEGSGALHAGKTLNGIKAAPLRHALKRADGDVVALVKGADTLPVLGENFYDQREEHVLDALDAQRERLRDEHVAEAVDRKAREAVRLAENNAAGVNIGAHHCLAVFPRIAHAPLPKGRVEAVVGIC